MSVTSVPSSSHKQSEEACAGAVEVSFFSSAFLPSLLVPSVLRPPSLRGAVPPIFGV